MAPLCALGRIEQEACVGKGIPSENSCLTTLSRVSIRHFGCVACAQDQAYCERLQAVGVMPSRLLNDRAKCAWFGNPTFAFLYNTLGVPPAAGVLYPFFGLLLNPMIAAAAMSFSSVSVIGNSLRLRTAKL